MTYFSLTITFDDFPFYYAYVFISHVILCFPPHSGPSRFVSFLYCISFIDCIPSLTLHLRVTLPSLRYLRLKKRRHFPLMSTIGERDEQEMHLFLLLPLAIVCFDNTHPTDSPHCSVPLYTFNQAGVERECAGSPCFI